MGEVGFAGGSSDEKKKKRKPGRKKGAEPSLKVKLYARKLIENKGNKRQAALAAGYTESMANAAKQKIEDKHREYFQRLANAAIPDELLILKLREGLDATTVKTATFEGQITDEKEYADFPERRACIELAAEFKGVIQRRGGAGQTQVNVPIMLVHSIPRPDRTNGSSS